LRGYLDMGWLKKIDCRANGKAVFWNGRRGVNFICIYGVKVLTIYRRIHRILKPLSEKIRVKDAETFLEKLN